MRASLIVLLACIYAVSAQVTVLTARLNGASQVPAVSSPYSGIFVAFYDQASSIINYFVLHNVPPANTTAAHIHGLADVNGTANVIFNVTNALNNQYYAGQWTDTNGLYRQALFNGSTYFNVHSTSNPSGEIRGQIRTANSTGVTHIALLDFQSQNLFTTNPPSSKGLGLFSLSLTNSLNCVVQHQVANTTAAHIHGNATFCVNAGVTFGFTNPANEINQAFQYGPGTLEPLAAQLQYVNVHSVAFPNGEVRGQIIPVSFYEGTNKNTFVLSGCNPTAAPTPTPTPAPSGTPVTTAAPGTTATPTTTKASSAATVAVSAMTVALAAVAMF